MKGVLQMFVRECMNKDVISILPEDTLIDALYMMLLNNISGMPVVNKFGQLVGIISKRDIYSKGLSKVEDMREVTVKERMTLHVYTVTPDTGLYDAIDMMTNRDINRIPVQKHGKIVGIITRTDIISYCAKQQQWGA